MKLVARVVLACAVAGTAAWSLPVNGGTARAGEEVWSPNPLVPLFEGESYAGKNDPNAAVRIVGARNGAFSGQVVLASAEPVKGQKAEVSDLKQKDGKATIPASAVEVWYAEPSGTMGDVTPKGKNYRGRLDGLMPAPPATGKVHVVWLTVNVPADAAPGDYEGKLTLAGREIPVRLSVADWKMPEPKDFTTHIGFIQSPDSVALRYGDALWSDKHWERVSESLKLLGKLGNKAVYLPMVAETHFGNSESLVRWIKDGDKYKQDYSVMEKYLDLYLKLVGKPSVVCLYMWDPRQGYSWGKGDEGRSDGVKGFKAQPPRVTLLDGGKVSSQELPFFGEGNSEELWKPALDGVRERLKARGLDGAMMIGFISDKKPDNKTVDCLVKVAPGVPWVMHSHPFMKEYRGAKIGYICHVWGVGSTSPRIDGRKYGWQQKPGNPIITAFPRFGAGFVHRLGDNAMPAIWQCVCEAGSIGGIQGFGRVGADFWPVKLDGKNVPTIIDRYPANFGQLCLTNAGIALLHPGPEGATPTIRYELLRSGIAENEARIAIERALLDKALRSKLGEDLGKRAQELLDARTAAIKDANGNKDNKNWTWYANESGWQDSAQKLFQIAGEVSKSLGAK